MVDSQPEAPFSVDTSMALVMLAGSLSRSLFTYYQMIGANCITYEQSVKESVDQIQEDERWSHIFCTFEKLIAQTLAFDTLSHSSTIKNL